MESAVSGPIPLSFKSSSLVVILLNISFFWDLHLFGEDDAEMSRVPMHSARHDTLPRNWKQVLPASAFAFSKEKGQWVLFLI